MLDLTAKLDKELMRAKHNRRATKISNGNGGLFLCSTRSKFTQTPELGQQQEIDGRKQNAEEMPGVFRSNGDLLRANRVEIGKERHGFPGQRPT